MEPTRDLAPGTVPFIDLDQLTAARGRGAHVIDLRAPVEFADDRIPGALNVPLFEDETRSFVGLLYKQFSPEAAFQEGRAAVAGRVGELVREVGAIADWTPPKDDDLVHRVLGMTSGGIERLDRELQVAPAIELPPHPVVFSCARGGLRSRSVVALMRSIGLEGAVGLEGGYRSWRKHVMSAVEDWKVPSRVVSLRGLTGVGKTLVLRAIEARRPGWTLDLEGLAGHRSSLLGMVGLQPVSQKAFESGLVLRAQRGFPGHVMVVEGESRKVGDVVIPRLIWEAMGQATNVDVVASTARRVQVLSEDYLADPLSRPLLREQLVRVASRMPATPDLAGMLDRDEIDELVRELLERYYDPLYRASDEGKEYAVRVDAESAEDAADRIVAWIEGGYRPE